MTMNIPNKITCFRIILVPFLAFCLLNINMKYSPIFSLFIFVLASISDFLDGYIARKYNMITDLGIFLDPIADKILVITTMICMIPNEMCHPAVVIIVTAREFIISSLRCLAASKSVVIAAGLSGKIKTAFQMFAVIGILCIYCVDSITGSSIPVHIISNVLMWLTTIPTIISCIDYLVKNRRIFSAG